MPETRAATELERAVRELVSRSEWAIAEAQASAERLARAAELIEVQRIRALRRLRERRARLEARVAAEHEATTAKLAADFSAEQRQLDAELASVKEAVGDESGAAERKAKRELDHAVWAAESIYEAEKQKLSREYRDVEEATSTFSRNLEAALAEAGRLVKRYGQGDLIAVSPQAKPARDPRPTDVAMKEEWEKVQQGLARLRGLGIPQWYVGYQAHMVGVVLAVGVGVAVFFLEGWRPTPVSVGATVMAAAAIAFVVWALGRRSRRQVREAFVPLQEAGFAAREAAERRAMDAAMHAKETQAARRRVRDDAIRAAKEKIEPVLAEVSRRRERRLAKISEQHDVRMQKRVTHRDGARDAAEAAHRERVAALAARYDRREALVAERERRRLAERDAEAAAEKRRIEEDWRAAWDAVAEAAARTREGAPRPVTDPADWAPPREHPRVLPFGEVAVDAGRLIEGDLPFDPPRAPIALPALLDMPVAGSVLWQFDREGRDEAVASVQAVVTRLLTAMPPGDVRLTIIDPVGLGQNFAGFMHLVDYQEELVGPRIWTGADQIEQRLIDLTEHMENVIQKYLRNEYESIDQYNAQAGELAEPYRFLVITDLPANFSETSAARLKSILASGPRCGVYTLITFDRRQPLPAGLDASDLERHSVNLVFEGGRFVWKDGPYERFDLRLDPAPDESTLTALMRTLGQAAREGHRVEVPFDSIAPRDGEAWSLSSSKVLRVPVGKSGATRLQDFTLGKDVAQHALIAGKTGSGKSTLLHVFITNLALWYSPDEVEFYLIDFKKGVEFKAYATRALPHARAVAVESDREFGLSVLQRLDAEITRRGDLFRGKGVQEINAYRKALPEARMPRVLLVIDEFQEFFSEDDKIAQDAALLLDRLVRQGRAFGIHAVLGSQTLAGASNLPRSTIGQMAVRVALQCSDADSQLILGDNNSAARLLSRPGEAIYNDAGGLLEGNSPFQVSWLSDAQRDAALQKVRERAKAAGYKRPEPLIVFEGNAAADLAESEPLADRLTGDEWPKPGHTITLPLGGAVAIKEPTAAILRRQSGANVLVVGQQEETALALTVASLLAVATQLPPESCRFVVLDGTAPDAPHADLLPWLVPQLPHPAKLVAWRDVPAVMHELAAEAAQRQEANQTNAPAVFTVVHGLQRYRMLRKAEDDFSFSMDEDKEPKPDKQFATLLREGSPVGMHTLVWCDSLTTLERTLDRQTMKEFDNRVLFQMSAGDSSNLIDSPAASQLGFYRALFANDERGLLEKFRPYGLPERRWIEDVLAKLRKRSAVTSDPV